MARIVLFLILIQVSLVQNAQIIADHTVVDKFNNIPQYYIDQVKKMWLVNAGESHSYGVRYGLSLVQGLNAKYAVSITDGIPWVATNPDPEAYTTSHLRASGARWGDYDNATGWIYWHGEEDWFTNPTAISRTKASIAYCNSHNLTVSALTFGWCWDAMGTGPTADADPVYGVRWWGSSVDGPSGDKAWGLNSAQYAITGNLISMQTYLDVMQEYVDYCTTNNISTKVFFATGPVDTYNGNYGAECMYQAHLKYQYIRDWITAHPSSILFDYADILCYDDNGTLTTTSWNGHIYPSITTTNSIPQIEGHISAAGELRLGKAMWWMLARIAGWDGGIATGINDMSKNNTSEPFAELNKDEIRVKINDSYQFATVSLYSFNGTRIAVKKADGNSCIFNISHLPAGLYLVVLSTTNNHKTQKIIIP